MGEYLNSFYGKELLEKYNLSDYGTWRIEGEDPVDFGGFNHLATVEGTLGNVIHYALRRNDFYSWAGGGRITKETVQKIDPKPLQRRKALKRLDALTLKIASVKKELENL
jgi:hypothetical protein